MSTEFMNDTDKLKKVHELISDVDIAMLTSVDQHGHLHSRPMGTQKMEFDGNLWFFTDRTSPKVTEIQMNHQVNVAYAHPGKSTYVSVRGEASIVESQGKMQELWNPLLKAWFPDGLNDPALTLIKVEVGTVEYWDTPNGKLVTAISFVKSILTGEEADLGENETVRFD